MVCHSYHHAQIEEKQFQKKELLSSRFNFLFSQKTRQSILSWLQETFSSSTTLKQRLSGDRYSLTSELESKMFLKDLPMRQRPVKSPCLCLTISSSSELEESSLEKSKSLRAAYAQDIIFWNFFFFLSPKWYFFLSSLLLLESFWFCCCNCWRSRASSSWDSWQWSGWCHRTRGSP
jgi:hypothetical protein